MPNLSKIKIKRLINQIKMYILPKLFIMNRTLRVDRQHLVYLSTLQSFLFIELAFGPMYIQTFDPANNCKSYIDMILRKFFIG